MEEKIELQEEDLELLDKKGAKEFAKKLGENRKKASKAIRIFFNNVGTEAKETKEASKILMKFIREGKVKPEEEKELKQQIYDLLKLVGVGVPFVLIPGSALLIPFLAKIAEKRGVNLFPSSFSKNTSKDKTS